MRVKRFSPLAIVSLGLALLAGCAPYPLVHSELQQRARLMRAIVLLPPDVKVYRLGVTGGTELVIERSDQAKKSVATAVKSVLGEKGIDLREFPLGKDPGLIEELEDVRALFEAVVSGMGPTGPALAQFGEPLRYSLGPLPKLARASETDALLMVYGVDRIATGGRMTLRVLHAAALLNPLLAADPESAILMASLVDPQTGDLLWFNRVSSAVYLEDLSNATHLASRLLSGFDLPGARR